MRKYFGTDGIRGTVNQSTMNAFISLKVGMAIALKFRNKYENVNRHRIVIGKDTRISGYLIESSLVAGITSMGVDVILLGPVPTPAVSMLTKSLRADGGIMISASHNPYNDNGIKIFDANGDKLEDKIEMEIEELIDANLDKYQAVNEKIGRAIRIDDVSGRYIEYVKNSFDKKKNLNKLKIVLDCANGAAYKIAPKIFSELGADVIEISSKPNGFNINDKCGSTHPELLCETVVKNSADLGIALDGDADRLLLCDQNGKVINGDYLLAIIAEKLHNEGKLKNDTLVTTIMSNMALENYLREYGISVIRSKVGDRYVIEEMRKNGLNFGGEQSGHIILANYSATGDALIASLQILEKYIDFKTDIKKEASDFFNIFELNHQLLKNIKLDDKLTNILNDSNFTNFINQLEAELKNIFKEESRILIRKSGTENLIRILIEGKDIKIINSYFEKIMDFIKEL